MPSERRWIDGAAVAAAGAVLAVAAPTGTYVLAGLALLAAGAAIAAAPAAREHPSGFDALLACAAVAQVVVLEVVLHAIHAGAGAEAAAIRAALAGDAGWVAAACAGAGLQAGAVARLAAAGRERVLLLAIAVASCVPALRFGGIATPALAGLAAGAIAGVLAAQALALLRPRAAVAPVEAEHAAPSGEPAPSAPAARADLATPAERLLLRATATGFGLVAMLALLYALSWWRTP